MVKKLPTKSASSSQANLKPTFADPARPADSQLELPKPYYDLEEALSNEGSDLREFCKLITTAFRTSENFATAGELACQEAVQAIRKRVLNQKAGKQDRYAQIKCLIALDASVRVLNSYASLNFRHLSDIIKVVHDIDGYALDRSLKQPFNFVLLAAPGAGKSHLVDCIAKKVKASIGVEKFNMATMESNRDLIPVIDACRNHIVERKLPLVFLDEFDSDKSRFPLLLPLLWDGKLDIENRKLHVGRSIFILAGSGDLIPQKLSEIEHCQTPDERPPVDGKDVDLLSRISGSVIRVPPFPFPSRYSSNENSFSAEQVVIGVALLRQRFRKCERVPVGFLRFLAKAHFRHNARSLMALINQIPRLQPATKPNPGEEYEGESVEMEEPEENSTTDPATQPEIRTAQLLKMPLNSDKALKESPLANHLWSRDGSGGVVKLWRKCMKNDQLQEIYSKPLSELQTYTISSFLTLIGTFEKLVVELAKSGP